MVRDPEVLARFPLERVLSQIIATGGMTLTPTEFLQRLFDTENTAASAAFADNDHCDTLKGLQKPVDCPRAEGRLARSTGLFTPGDPDFFAPVALVNRFDLMPSDLSGCGEYRIVYAKQSGLVDPSNRVFLIFESALESAGFSLAACRPVAELLAWIDDPPEAFSRADALGQFYFAGIGGIAPVVHAKHYAVNTFNCFYGKCGQIRVGQGMQAPWQFRQFRLQNVPGKPSAMQLVPTPDTGSPRPELFEIGVAGVTGENFRNFFVRNVSDLTEVDVARLRMTSFTEYDAVDSSLDGPAQPNYLERVTRDAANAPFMDQIAAELDRLDLKGCPPDDPLTPASILRRATALTCAGCHAPEHLLSSDRRIGCGGIWPNSLGQAHIDEWGQLSEAMTQVFLPRRAKVLGTYLQACDEDAIRRNLLPVPPPVVRECLVAGTPVTMGDGSEKAIEKIVPGELVLTYDGRSHAIVPGHVERTFVRPHTDSLVVVNGSLIATPNHAFYTARGWTRAESLEVGDVLIRAANVAPSGSGSLDVAPAAIEGLAVRPGSVTTYNLEVAVHHSYFAAGLLVQDGP